MKSRTTQIIFSLLLIFVVVDMFTRQSSPRTDPVFAPVAGTSLLWVSNTESDLFRHQATGAFDYRVAGRELKRIPPEHPRSRVLASVPGMDQATEAVLLAQVPQTARLNVKQIEAPEVDDQEGTFAAVAGFTEMMIEWGCAVGGLAGGIRLTYGTAVSLQLISIHQRMASRPGTTSASAPSGEVPLCMVHTAAQEASRRITPARALTYAVAPSMGHTVLPSLITKHAEDRQPRAAAKAGP